MQKVLLITYYWPPAGGPGVQRWLGLVRYLTEFGVEPIVFAPENPKYPIEDASLLNAVPNGVTVIKHPIWEPYRLAGWLSKKKTKRISSGIILKQKRQSALERILLWIRGNLFIPDARKFWVGPAVKRIKKIVITEQIKKVITTGPPHSLHLIGLQLKEQLGVQWIADFRDPWTSIGYHNKLKLTLAAQKKHKRLEKKVLQSANQIIVTSNTTKAAFAKLTPRPVSVITNGYGAEGNTERLDEKFTLSHIGSLLTDRNPGVLWEVLQELVNEDPAFAKSLHIRLIGVLGDGVCAELKTKGLYGHVEEMGYLSHEQVRQYQAKSQVLLLLEIDSKDTQGIIPGKLFEYLSAKRPILALGPDNWEAGELVEAHNAGRYMAHHQKDTLKKVLSAWFKQFQKGDLNCESQGVEKFHRKELAKQLAELLYPV